MFLFRFTVVIITLACTETGIKTSKFFFFFFLKEVPQNNPCSGSNADAEIRSLCRKHRAAKVLPLNPGVGQNTAMHASPAAWNLLLVLISTLQVHSPTLCSLVPKFLTALVVVNAVSPVDPQNKRGNTANCHDRLKQIPVSNAVCLLLTMLCPEL